MKASHHCPLNQPDRTSRRPVERRQYSNDCLPVASDYPYVRAQLSPSSKILTSKDEARKILMIEIHFDNLVLDQRPLGQLVGPNNAASRHIVIRAHHFARHSGLFSYRGLFGIHLDRYQLPRII